VPLQTRISIIGEDGDSLLAEAICTNIGLGGLCVRAEAALSPGTVVHVELRLGGGRPFASQGHVCWSKLTLHPALFGTPRGMPDDACFGICFEGLSTQDLLPIARLMVAREDSRRRAQRIRRFHGLPARA
jgi:hypothetical protein